MATIQDLPIEIIEKIALDSRFVWGRLSLVVRVFGLWSIQKNIKQRALDYFAWKFFVLVVSGRKRPTRKRRFTDIDKRDETISEIK